MADPSDSAPIPEALQTKLPPGWTEGVEVKQYKGACHCHKFEYEFEHPSLESSKASVCNCSICTQRGCYLV